MIYTSINDWVLKQKKGDLLRCHECGKMTDTIFAFWEDGRNDMAICHRCVRLHYEHGDTGIYPVETGMGIVSSTMLLFDDWSEFFDLGDHRERHWQIEEYDQRLWMKEINKGGWSTRRYQLIATEKMLQDFKKIHQMIL